MGKSLGKRYKFNQQFPEAADQNSSIYSDERPLVSDRPREIVSASMFKKHLTFIIICSAIFTLMDSVSSPYFDLFFFLYQGILVNPALTIGYATVFINYRAFLKFYIIRSYGIISELEITQINRTKNEVKWYFIYISQMLVIQSIYLGLMFVREEKLDGAKRIYDIVNIVLMVSQILMYFGLSNSIKRAYNAQREKHTE